MRGRKIGISLHVLTVMAMLLVSCTPALAPTPPSKAALAPTATGPSAAPVATAPAALTAPSPTSRSGAEQPRYGGILTIGTGGDPPSLDPHQETTNYTLGPVAPSYNSLLQYDPLAWPEANIVPDLAENWQVSPDGTLLTFRFPKGVSWHDRTPFTSEDAKFSIERIREPTKGMRSPRAELFRMVDRIETPDPDTLVLRLKYATASFVPTLAMGWNLIVPQHIVQAKGDLKKDVVGTGPFKFKSYDASVSYDSVKNSSYFRRGRPYLDGVKWYIIRDSSTRFSALRTGRVLMITPTPGVSASEAELLEKSIPNFVAQRKAITATMNIMFNLKMPPWDQVKVRQAVNLALDREAVINAALQGRGVIGGLLYPEGEWSLPKTELLKKPGYRKPTETDILEAKRLLAEAGFPNGFKSSITARMDLIESYRPAELLKTDMAKLGIDFTIDPKESAGYFDAMEKRSFQVTVKTTGLHLEDPDGVFPMVFTTNAGQNYMGYSDPKVDELTDKQSRTLDKAERLKIVRQLEDIIMEANPAPVVSWNVRIGAHSKDVRDWKAAPAAGFNNMMQEVWLAK